jgi:hypothetical protein
MASSLPHTLLQIDGTDVDAKQRIEIVNPLKRQVVGTCAAATEKDCIAAVDAAARAFPAWEAVPLAKKRDIFLKTAELLESDAYRSRLMEVQKREMAATPGWSAVGVGGAVNYFRTTAGLASELQGRVRRFIDLFSIRLTPCRAGTPTSLAVPSSRSCEPLASCSPSCLGTALVRRKLLPAFATDPDQSSSPPAPSPYRSSPAIPSFSRPPNTRRLARSSSARPCGKPAFPRAS